MESAENLANGASDGSFDAEEAERTLANRRMYYEHQLNFDREHLPPHLAAVSDDELRALFSDLLNATKLCSWSDFPLPCRGLPGFLHNKYDQTDEAGELIVIGLEYLEAVVNNERRTMHLRWRAAKEMIRELRNKAQSECELRIFAHETEEAEARISAAAPQLVYFIAAASGPIKIGIATSPKARLSGLQTSHHEKLELLATCEGGQSLERAYHKRFSAFRLHGEWFERCPEIEAEIARLNAPNGGNRD